jgi:hypothetical protein
MVSRTYELTEKEYKTIRDALAYSAENAIHEYSRQYFEATHAELTRQHDSQDGSRIEEKDRLEE